MIISPAMSGLQACKECLQVIFSGNNNPWRTFVIGLGAVYIGWKVQALVLRLVVDDMVREEEARDGENVVPGGVYKKDIVYLHTYPACLTKQVPHLSPYSIKLESWMKLRKISYEIVPTTRFLEETNQLPYIRLNDNCMSDTSLIINYLTDYFHIDPSEGLSDEQLAVSRALQRMVDDGLSWTYLIDRYTFRPELFKKFFKPTRLDKNVCEKIREGLGNIFERQAHCQGTGRHKAISIARMGMEDILAISRYLGDKQFLMGDSITKVDCAVFGHLSQIAFVDFPYPHKMLFTCGCENLREYLFRVRDALWPDWFDRSAPGEFKY